MLVILSLIRHLVLCYSLSNSSNFWQVKAGDQMRPQEIGVYESELEAAQVTPFNKKLLCYSCTLTESWESFSIKPIYVCKH